MADTNTRRRTETVLKPAKPPLHKVILINDDYTPREFVVRLLKAEFRVPEAQANAKQHGFPLLFSTEPEE
jgi:ATP-dependent Clp protease adaptor protein ClpS